MIASLLQKEGRINGKRSRRQVQWFIASQAITLPAESRPQLSNCIVLWTADYRPFNGAHSHLTRGMHVTSPQPPDKHQTLHQTLKPFLHLVGFDQPEHGVKQRTGHQTRPSPPTSVLHQDPSGPIQLPSRVFQLSSFSRRG